ncbi:MAG: RraA family protein, partial [Firmicutes bacterium]|nr:RraA family protein [Bacillota bacterium]
MSLLTPAELAALKKFDSPTISNAIEGFKVRPRNE